MSQASRNFIEGSQRIAQNVASEKRGGKIFLGLGVLLIAGALATGLTNNQSTNNSPETRTHPDGAKGSAAALYVGNEQAQPTPTPFEPIFPLISNENTQETLIQPTDIVGLQTSDGPKKFKFENPFIRVPLNTIDTNVLVDAQIIKKTENGTYHYYAETQLTENPNDKIDYRQAVYENGKLGWMVPDARKNTTTPRIEPIKDSTNYLRGLDAIYAAAFTENGETIPIKKSNTQWEISGQQLVDLMVPYVEDSNGKLISNPNSVCNLTTEDNKIVKIRYIPKMELSQALLGSLPENTNLVTKDNQSSLVNLERDAYQRLDDNLNDVPLPANQVPHMAWQLYGEGLSFNKDCTNEYQRDVDSGKFNNSEGKLDVDKVNSLLNSYDNTSPKDHEPYQPNENEQVTKFLEDSYNLIDKGLIKPGEQILEDLPSPLVPRQIMRDKANIERVQIGLIPLLNIFWSAAGFLIYFPKKTRKLGAFILGIGSVIGFCNIGLAYFQKAIEILLFVPQVAIALLSGLTAATQLKLLEKQAQRQ